MKPGDQVHTPPGTAPASTCGHPNAGQELCYLCHQRSRRNVPVSFTEERKRREDEEDRLLQQYQYMKDAENVLNETVISTGLDGQKILCVKLYINFNRFWVLKKPSHREGLF